MRRISNPTSHPARRRATVAVSIACAAAFLACSDSTGVAKGTASQLAFATGSGASAAAAPAAVVPIMVGGHTLNFTQVTLTISRAELKRTAVNACMGDDDDSGPGPGGSMEHCADVRIGATSIDLPLDGSLVTLPANTIPAGTFRELEFRVAFVRLRGTFDAKPFDVTVDVNAKNELEFATPLVVTDSTPTSITVNVPVATWFVNADGSLVDPSKFAQTPSLLESVKKRIATSLRAFEDRDHNGKDDHGDHDHGKGGDGN